MVGRTSSGPNRRAIHPSTRLRQDGSRRGTDAPALRNRSSQNAMWSSSIAARLVYTLASRGSGSPAAIARYSAALSTSSCQFSRYRAVSLRSPPINDLQDAPARAPDRRDPREYGAPVRARRPIRRSVPPPHRGDYGSVLDGGPQAAEVDVE